MGVDNEVAVIEVSDRGDGLDTTLETLFESERAVRPSLDGIAPENVPEQGRGIFLMRALMDHVQFHRVEGPRQGTRVHLEKTLDWEESAPGAQLSRARKTTGPWGTTQPPKAADEPV